MESFLVSSYIFPRPLDSLTGPPGIFPGNPLHVSWISWPFLSYIGQISFDGNNDDLALLVVHYLKHLPNITRKRVKISRKRVRGSRKYARRSCKTVWRSRKHVTRYKKRLHLYRKFTQLSIFHQKYTRKLGNLPRKRARKPARKRNITLRKHSMW